MPTINVQNSQSMSFHLHKNVDAIKQQYSNCADIVFRYFKMNGMTNACLIYISGLVNIDEVDDNVLSPLIHGKWDESVHIIDILAVTEAKNVTTLKECITLLANANILLLVEDKNEAISISLIKTEHRQIQEPIAEEVVRGPREGFIEALSTNISLLRKIIKTPKLKMKEMTFGKQTNTRVVISYMEDIASPSLVQEVINRMRTIDIDAILDSHVIEEFIEDNPYSPFPQMLTTERPDTVAGQLLEGRIAILVDGTPFALVAPATFFSQFQSSEDYYSGYMETSLIRSLRFIFLFISLLLPAIYVAVTSFHQEMIPTTLLLKIMAAREEVPLPVFIEVLIMEVTFEALREAGLRLPKQVGSAVSIVGALVIGESAVSAGIVSAPVVIIVALTGIASFTIPKYHLSSPIRILRFPLIFLGSLLGLLGVIFGFIALLVHLSSLRSFGEAYLDPISPFKKKELKDTLVRVPWWAMHDRPEVSQNVNRQREAPHQKPTPNEQQ